LHGAWQSLRGQVAVFRDIRFLQGLNRLSLSLAVCLSIEKLTTLPTELLTTPLWNIWAVPPLLRIRRGVSVSLTSSATGQYLGGV